MAEQVWTCHCRLQLILPGSQLEIIGRYDEIRFLCWIHSSSSEDEAIRSRCTEKDAVDKIDGN